jgi:hypothetical protein
MSSCAACPITSGVAGVPDPMLYGASGQDQYAGDLTAPES